MIIPRSPSRKLFTAVQAGVPANVKRYNRSQAENRVANHKTKIILITGTRAKTVKVCH